VIVAGDRYRG